MVGFILVISSNCLIISQEDYYDFMGRVLLGVSYGIIHLTLIVHASDNATAQYQKSILSTITFTQAFSALLAASIIYPHSEADFEKKSYVQIIGSFILILLLPALILTRYCTKESVRHLIAIGEEKEALRELIKLRNTRKQPTIDALQADFDEMRVQLFEELQMDKNICRHGNSLPLALITGARVLWLLFTNVPTNVILLWWATDDYWAESYEVPPTVSPLGNEAKEEDATEPVTMNDIQSILEVFFIIQLFRMVAELIFVTLSKRYHLNRLFYSLAFICGASMYLLTEPTAFITFGLLALLGIRYETMFYVQGSEAFSYNKKPGSIAFTAIVDNLMHTFLILQIYFDFGMFFVFIVNGSAMIAIGLWLKRMLPDEAAIRPVIVKQFGQWSRLKYLQYMQFESKP